MMVPYCMCEIERNCIIILNDKKADLYVMLYREKCKRKYLILMTTYGVDILKFFRAEIFVNNLELRFKTLLC